MNVRCAAALLAAALVFPGAGMALPARPEGPVADLANILDAQTTSELDGLIRQTRGKNGAVLVVTTVPSLEGMTIEDYASRLFKEWGIGEKGKNNGVLLLVAPTERKVRIEVGYGLEGLLPDGRCGQIIRADILPAFRRGAAAEGVQAGARAIARTLQGDAVEASSTEKHPTGNGSMLGALILALAAFVIGLALGFSERGHRWALLICLLGLIPALYGVWLALKVIGSMLWAIALIAFGAGEHLGSGRITRRTRTRGGGWTSGGFGGWSGGGAGGGGSFGGFGGGFSGGGGASGSW